MFHCCVPRGSTGTISPVLFGIKRTEAAFRSLVTLRVLVSLVALVSQGALVSLGALVNEPIP